MSDVTIAPQPSSNAERPEWFNPEWDQTNVPFHSAALRAEYAVEEGQPTGPMTAREFFSAARNSTDVRVKQKMAGHLLRSIDPRGFGFLPEVTREKIIENALLPAKISTTSEARQNLESMRRKEQEQRVAALAADIQLVGHHSGNPVGEAYRPVTGDDERPRFGTIADLRDRYSDDVVQGWNEAEDAGTTTAGLPKRGARK
jgi:hypothetical protein